MAGKITKIAVLAPFAAGIGRTPGKYARINGGSAEELEAALDVFGRECVLEVERGLVADGRVSIPLIPLIPHIPSDGHTADAWFSQVCQKYLKQAGPEQNGTGVQGSTGAAAPADSSRDPLQELLDMVNLPEQPPAPVNKSLQVNPTPEKTSEKTAESALLNHILQHPVFQARCAAWQGLSWIHALADNGIQLLLVDIDHLTFLEELPEIRKRLMEDEPELLVVDMPLSNTPRDQQTLADIAETADQLLAPVLTWLDCSFWGLTSWQELHRLGYLPTLLEQPSYAKWRALRKRDAARLLLTAVGRFAFAGQPSSSTFWISPVWAIAAAILKQQASTGSPYTVLPISPRSQLVKTSTPVPPSDLTPLTTFTTLTTEADFSEDRCLQFQEVRQAALTGTATTLYFAGLPMCGSSNLDLQLLIRSLLSWLFSLDPGLYRAETLQVLLSSMWDEAGMKAPADIEFTQDDEALYITIQPLADRAFGGGEITMQLQWQSKT